MHSGPVELLASGSVLGSWLSGVAQRSGEATGERVSPRASCCPERCEDPVRLQASDSAPGQPFVRRGAERSGVAAGE